ncbi:hypothetical protein HaLaN_05156 [Haematococcus lacustris]|uniref:Uncharacterized protein n=1 Tax=Haematococcus lacustris TaxID=44745 RepID=A0A699YKU8_HAELA|nr:hypothetical protein HaLaN_05156 [Haematococcus lacustris]
MDRFVPCQPSSAGNSNGDDGSNDDGSASSEGRRHPAHHSQYSWTYCCLLAAVTGVRAPPGSNSTLRMSPKKSYSTSKVLPQRKHAQRESQV